MTIFIIALPITFLLMIITLIQYFGGATEDEGIIDKVLDKFYEI